MKKKVLFILVIIIMTVSVCMAAVAAENPSATKAQLHSEGAIRYSGKEGEVIIDTADLYTLADQLDLFKIRAVKQLGVMRTYLTRSDGDVALTSADNVYAVHKEPAAGEEVDPLLLDFATILEGIAVSQSIPTDPVTYGLPEGTTLYKRADGTLSTSGSDGAEQIYIRPAEAENLSAGTAAWVNGKLLLGTGADMAEMLEEISRAQGEGTGIYSIASGYKLPKDVPVAIAYVVTTNWSSSGEDGNTAGSDPVLTVSSCKNLTRLYAQRYAKYGFNVRVGLYRITGMPAGTVVQGSDGLLFY